MGRTMRAAVLRRHGAPLEITEVSVQDPRAGEVLVKVAASGVCGSDLKAIAGKSAVAQQPPYVLGHESAGVIAAVGPAVTAVRPGDHVVIAMSGPCGRCGPCSRGRLQGCASKARLAAIMGLMGDGSTRLRAGEQAVRPFIGIGSFAEYAVVSELMCVKVAADAPLDLLALTACGVITGVGAVARSVLVFD